MKFKQIFCKHEWSAYAFMYVECRKCNKRKYDPKLNWELSRHIWDLMDDNSLPAEVLGLKQFLRKNGMI